MMTVAYPLSRDEREAVAAYLGKAGPEPGPPASAFCSDRSVKISNSPKFAWNGWSPASNNARFQSADAAGLTISQVGHLKLKWAFGFDGDITAWAQPTVIDGQVFVGSAGGVMHALRAETGCLQWTFQANGPVRSAITAAPLHNGHVLLFSDHRRLVLRARGRDRPSALEEAHGRARSGAADGRARWCTTGSSYVPVASWEETRSLNPGLSVLHVPRQHNSRCGFAMARPVWKTYTIAEMPKQNRQELDRHTAIRTVRRGRVVHTDARSQARRALCDHGRQLLGSRDQNRATRSWRWTWQRAKILWSKQTMAGDAYNVGLRRQRRELSRTARGPDYDFGSSAILAKTARRPRRASGGTKVRHGLRARSRTTTVRSCGKRASAKAAPSAACSGAWRATASAFMPRHRTRTRHGQDGAHFWTQARAAASRRCASPMERKAWYAPPMPVRREPTGCSPAQSAAVTAIPGVVFSGSMDGHLRAYSAEDGKVLWDFDTARAYQAVNGVAGHGGTHRRTGAGGGEWHAVRQFRVPAVRRYAGQRAAGVRTGRPISNDRLSPDGGKDYETNGDWIFCGDDGGAGCNGLRAGPTRFQQS